MSRRARASLPRLDRSRWGGRAAGHLSSRAPVVIVVALVAAIVQARAPRPPDPTTDGVASMLGAFVGARVDPDGFVWESGRGSLEDALWGRHVLFLGSSAEGSPRDLYRARVRVSPSGRPIAVASARNLTETPLGDEGSLVARGHHAAVLTTAFGQVQGATVFDLAGAPKPRASKLARFAADLRAWVETDSWGGLERTELVFGRPPKRAELALEGGVLAVAVREPSTGPILLHLADGTLEQGSGQPQRAETWRAPAIAEPWYHSAMDTARRLLGTDFADGIKSLLFRGRSGLRRLLERWRGSSGPRERVAAAPVPEPPTGPAQWPPEPIAPLFTHALEGEGLWRAPSDPWLLPPVGTDGGERGADPYLVETIIRPDPDLPFAEVRLVAMDMRQLELRIEAGFDEPRPETGPRGRGRIPSPSLTPDSLRTVAAFNGAFQTEHGSYGMAVDRRILLPPREGAATVVVDTGGQTWMGSWSGGEELPGWASSLRQNLDPLLDAGAFNPRGRGSWGFPLEGGGILTERSALCLTRAGHLIYGWGIEVSPETLAHALQRAGCDYAMHLDMNPGHVGLTYLRVYQDHTEARLLAREMSIAPRRFVEASPKDFFYLVQRVPTPHLQLELDWRPDGAVQPAPAWLGAVHRAELDRMGATVTLWAFDAGRFEWELRPGERELAGRTALGALEPADQARALVALGLGVAFRKDNRRGLVLDGVCSLPVRPDLGLLTVDPVDRSLAIGLAPDPVAPPGDATELPLLAIRGELQSEARELGTMKLRSAACLTANETLLVAMSRFESGEANAQALLDLGCERVVELDRGSQVDAFVHRAGTEPAPSAEYDDTVLYGLATVMHGRARRLEPKLAASIEPEAGPPEADEGNESVDTTDEPKPSSSGSAAPDASSTSASNEP